MALALGRTVRQLQSEITSHEFSEWIAYYNLEPFGEERADVRAALICQTVANCLVERKDGQKFTPQDFLPDWGREHQSKQNTPEQLLEKARAIQSILSGLYEAKKKNG